MHTALTNAVVAVVVAVLGMHALLKLAFFFVLPYKNRRAALDRAYGNKPSATRTADAMLLAISIVVAGLLLWRGLEGVSFLGGLWIGATLIQLYFHRFNKVLSDEQAPPPAISPIKMISYAIQAEPARPWREMLLMAALIVWALVSISRHFL
jgi:hypothetical protein